ncbi:MAG: hypothetical protein K2O89_05555 [Clostridia bacterium]|nr:hypothetical protein [Clostridia bacterium]
MNTEIANDNLKTIKEQITKFDEKANSLIAIIGIIFAISTCMLDVFDRILTAEQTPELHTKYILLVIFAVTYFLSFFLTITFLILVILPRKKKDYHNISLSYYMDVANLNKEEIIKLINKDETIETIAEQLIVNSKICKRKHKFFVISIYSLIPLFISMAALFFIAIA